jgi:acyl-CoA reductase-like NAD-dependent aldehyde dehydrogenase
MPDADVDATVKALTGAGFGAAGEACTFGVYLQYQPFTEPL